MRYILSFFLSFLFFATTSRACMCFDFRTTEENIKLYPFIAYVKITSKAVNIDTTISGNDTIRRYAGNLAFDIIELFKGNAVKNIKEYEIRSSCEIGIYAGEEWVLFVSYDSLKKIYYVGACNPSQIVRNRKGEIDWSWPWTLSTVRHLRKFFNHPSPEDKYDHGQFKSYYPNGNLEWEAGYKDHKLNGPRKIYYSDGKIFVEENYVDGKHDGLYKCYNNAGQLIKEKTYTKGHCLISKEWNDYTRDPDGGHFIKTPEYKGRPAQAWLRRESFSPDTTFQIECNYYRDGLLERETIYYWKSHCVITRYYKTGEINYRITRYWDEKKEFYQQWSKEGKLTMEKTTIDGKEVNGQ